MAAEGALCGFIYLKGSTRAGPEDTEALAPVTLGIPDGLRNEIGGLRTDQDRDTPLPAGSAPQWYHMCEQVSGTFLLVTFTRGNEVMGFGHWPFCQFWPFKETGGVWSGNRPSLVTLAPKMLHRNNVLWAGLLGSSAGLGIRRQPLTAILSLSPQDTATTKKAALSFVPWRLPEEVNTMTGTWHCLR